jgi:threonyl-tRNA synthetase
MNNSEPNQELLKIRHTAEHVLMQAMDQLFPGKIIKAMGPATDQGFYFDFDTTEDFQVSESDFEKIEKKMQAIIDSNLPLVKQEVSPKKAAEIFKDNPYKLEWIKEAEGRGEPISIYYTGDPKDKDSFLDICAGPHADSTKEIRAFKLLSIAGAYWRGDEKNKMLTRIYGTAFTNRKELKIHLNNLEEAKKRDHRKLGKELDLFTFSDLVGKGLPLYTAKGTTIKNELYRSLLDISKKHGVQEVSIPHMAKLELYKISGHADKFEDELFTVVSHYKEKFILKPVNCPHHTQIYASRPRSYKELPLRYIESTMQHRDEKPGQIGGLTRTRSFSVDDGHTFCTVDQIKQEATNTCQIIEEFYKGLGLWDKRQVTLSVRDPKTPEKYIGEPKDWNKAEAMIQDISDDLKLNAKLVEGEAAIYGPKIDYMFTDALGNQRQLATVQVDFAMPKRFKLSFVNSQGQEETPVMLHRAILGSYERFLAILLEHFAGAFPVWLSPVQATVLPISEKFLDQAEKIKQELADQGIRAELDDSNESLGKKIRNAESQKTPYMLILGQKEIDQNLVSVRQRGQKDLGQMKLASFSAKIQTDIDNKLIF